jgi:uncharacterized protein (DUF697 family)
VDPSSAPDRQLQGLATEEFFYFFLRLRKSEIRRSVQTLRDRYPDEPPEALARRLIAAKTGLSLLGGALLYAPALVPGAGQAIQLLGLVGATSMLTRMHLYLILEIAHLYGRDIDDSARVPEMLAVVAATGLGAAAPMLVKTLGLAPLYSVPAGALSCGAVTQTIGYAAIRYYRHDTAATPDAAAAEVSASI